MTQMVFESLDRPICFIRIGMPKEGLVTRLMLNPIGANMRIIRTITANAASSSKAAIRRASMHSAMRNRVDP